MSGVVSSAVQRRTKPNPEATLAAIERITRRVLEASFRLPVLPAIAAELMGLTTQTEVNFRQVDKIVRGEPLLAARVLSVANSPMFAAGVPVISLRIAMMR